MEKQTLSVVIMAFNEEKKIKECLESIKNVADEIIVVDNMSSDKTVAIAKKYTKKIYHQKNEPRILDLQKNFGFSKAKGDWILSLDADERVTDSLALQIKAALTNDDPEISAYRIPRKNIIFGKWIQHTGWYPDFQLRLFRNKKAKYTAEHVHEEMEVDGKTDQLTEPLIHENYETMRQFINKMVMYAENEADAKIKKGYRYTWTDAVTLPTNEFLSRFFAREGYRDGFHGLMLSLLMSVYYIILFGYIWEKVKFVEAGTTDFLEDTKRVIEKSHKDMMYWLINEKIKDKNSAVKKILLKIQRKISNF